ncbi:hypothetical protein [Shewanella sp. GXUN23E]|uniref:hypothetical protein n=1 Tax=Shewanella sp. GXUN23E TaxID=3422498 RepID=UPI003D7F07B8
MNTNKELNVESSSVLRVVEYILSRRGESYSVGDAANALNGAELYKVAQIFRQVCLEPEGEKSLVELTTVDNANSHWKTGRWELTADAYFAYLNYQSLQVAIRADRKSNYALWVAIISCVVSIGSLLVAFMTIG